MVNLPLIYIFVDVMIRKIIFLSCILLASVAAAQPRFVADSEIKKIGEVVQKIFAGGDIASSKGTVAWAARAGRDAAEAISEYLENQKVGM